MSLRTRRLLELALEIAVPIALVAYLLTWTGWLRTSGGWARQWATEAPGNAWTGALAWVPDWAQSL